MITHVGVEYVTGVDTGGSIVILVKMFYRNLGKGDPWSYTPVKAKDTLLDVVSEIIFCVDSPGGRVVSATPLGGAVAVKIDVSGVLSEGEVKYYHLGDDPISKKYIPGLDSYRLLIDQWIEVISRSVEKRIFRSGYLVTTLN